MRSRSRMAPPWRSCRARPTASVMRAYGTAALPSPPAAALASTKMSAARADAPNCVAAARHRSTRVTNLDCDSLLAKRIRLRRAGLINLVFLCVHRVTEENSPSGWKQSDRLLPLLLSEQILCLREEFLKGFS